MDWLALILSVFAAAVGAYGVSSPEHLRTLLERLQSRQGLVGIAALRLVYGVALYVAGPSARSPQAIQLIGVVVIVAGMITPFLPIEFFRNNINRFLGREPLAGRIWCGLGGLFGLAVASQIRV